MTSRPRRQSGFVIVAVMLAVTLFVVVGATYLRHVVLDPQLSVASAASVDAADASDSALAFAGQALRLGRPDLVTSIDNGGRAASLSTTELADGHASIAISALDNDGLGTTLLAEMGRVPTAVSASHPDELPRVASSTLAAILADPSIPKQWISGQHWERDTDLTGLVIVENNASLWLDNVTLDGCIVSEDALLSGPFGDYDTSTAPSVVIDGNTRLSAGDFLPGVAACLPDGAMLTWTNPASVQIEGDVVAHSLSISGMGSIRGNIATATPATLDSQVQLPGQGRRPLAWGAGFDQVTQWDSTFLATLPRQSSLSDLSAITGFRVP